jgi:hypothetical protein
MKRETSFSNMKPEDFYVCQIPDPAKVEEWVDSINTLDLRAPERHWCAMCCVRGLLLAERLPAPSLEDLFGLACKQGVYRPDSNTGWRGAYHQELAKFINTVRVTKQREASAHRRMKILVTPENEWFNMERLVSTGCYIILSVHPDIRLRTNVPPPNKNGHFVLVYDFFQKGEQKYFRINNPAGFQTHNSQIGMEVSAERLAQVSSGDGVVVKSNFSRLIGE